MLPPFGLFARIDARISGLLGPSGLAEIGSAGSLAELVEALRKSDAYAPYLAPLDADEGVEREGEGPARAAIERALMAKPLDDLRVLLPFASADSRAFVQTLIRGFEVENLKRVLRRHLSGRSGECGPAERAFAPAALYDAGTAARVPLALLREASSASDLVARLDGTSFHRPLADALPVAESTGSAFPLEIALDDDQIAACWRAAGRLSGGNREKTRLLLGVEADVLALLWAYRGRFLLGLGADEVLPRMPYFGARLAPNDRRAAAESETAAALAARIASGPYAGLLEEDGSIAPDRVDLRAARLLLAQARAVRAGLRFHLGQVVAFLWIADREVRDIGAVAECVHYGLGTAAMPRYVAGWPS